MTEEQRKKQVVEWVVSAIALIVGLYNHLALIKGWAHIEIVDTVTTQYVNWFYDTIVGIIVFWRNNNITSFAQLVQVLLNKLKNNTISPAQVEEFISNDTVRLVSEEIAKGNVTNEQIMAFLTEPQLKEIADAHNNGQTVNVNIQEV